MGQGLVITPERRAADARARDAEFPKSTAWIQSHLPALDEMASSRGLNPLSSFLYEPHPSEYDASWEEGDEIEEGAGEVRWFAPESALAVVDALIAALATNPEEWRGLVRSGQSGGVVCDDEELQVLQRELSEFRNCLAHVVERGVRIYLSLV